MYQTQSLVRHPGGLVPKTCENVSQSRLTEDERYWKDHTSKCLPADKVPQKRKNENYLQKRKKRSKVRENVMDRGHVLRNQVYQIPWSSGYLINCYDLDIKLVFSSFKICNLFGVKDPVPDGLRSRLVYKFVCAGCNACYVGETCRHFYTRVREHLVSDRASHIFSKNMMVRVQNLQEKEKTQDD